MNSSNVKDGNKDGNKHRNVIPEKCAACPAEIYVGLSCLLFACHLHALCPAHDVTEASRVHGCPYCRDIEEIERKRKEYARPEARNSMPLLECKAKVVAPAPNIFLYEYPPLWQTTSFNSVTSDRSIDIDAKPLTCWSAGDNDSIIVGGINKQDQATVSVVSATGRYITHVLSCGRDIISGLLVKMLLHIVCVAYDDKWRENISSKLHLITLDPTSTHSTIINPLITLDVTNPVRVFRKSTQLCGVLCMDGSMRPYTHGRIRLLGLDQLILPTCTNPRTLQSTALWGRRTLLHLDLPEPYPSDTVAVTPRGQYCIASYWRDEILVYSGTGVCMYSVGDQQSRTLHQGELFLPVSVQCTADNCVIVTGMDGDIQMYNMSSETGRLVRRKYDGKKYRMVEDDNSDEEYNPAGRRNVYYYKDDPAGWRIVRHRVRSRQVNYSALTSSRVWEIDYNLITSTTGIRVYNITQ